MNSNENHWLHQLRNEVIKQQRKSKKREENRRKPRGASTTTINTNDLSNKQRKEVETEVKTTSWSGLLESISHVRSKFQLSKLYTLLERYNPIMNTFEVLIYTCRSTGLFQIAQLLIELRRMMFISFRFVWSVLFLFDDDQRKRIEKQMRMNKQQQQIYPRNYGGYNHQMMANDPYDSPHGASPVYYDNQNYDNDNDSYYRNY